MMIRANIEEINHRNIVIFQENNYSFQIKDQVKIVHSGIFKEYNYHYKIT